MNRLLSAFFALAILIPTHYSKGYTVSGTTYTIDGSSSDFQSAVNAAPSGGTILFPAGTFNWSPSSTITVNKSLHIVGTGQSTCRINNENATGITLQITSGTDGNIWLTGIYFDQIPYASTSLGNIQVNFSRSDTLPPGPGNQYTVIVTYCTFDSGGHFAYSAQVTSNGLIFSHCDFPGGGLGGLQITCGYGTEHWNTPDTMGLSQDQTVYNGVGNGYATGTVNPLNVGDTAQGYMGVAGLNDTYIEDCTMENATSGCCNADGCARVVVRHCTITDGLVFGHGQDSSYMGMRQYEFYNNIFLCADGTGAEYNDNHYISCRGTVNLIANNQMAAITQAGGKYSIGIGCEQATLNSGPGGCQTAYPANRQDGIGWSSASSSTYGTPVVSIDGTGEASDPIFIWGNTGTGTSTYLWNYDNVSPSQCSSGLDSSFLIHQNRDFYLGVARPGWVPYTYPHPYLSASTPTPLAPTNLHIVTP